MVIFDKLNNNINISTKDNPKMSEEITINIDSCIKSEGDPDPKFTATVYAGGINDNKRILYDYTLTREAGEAAGIYDITLESADYEKSYVISCDRFLPTDCDVTLNVSPGTLTINASAGPVEPNFTSSVKIECFFENIWHSSEFDSNIIDQFEDYLISGYDLFNLDEQLSISGPNELYVYTIDSNTLFSERSIPLSGGIIPLTPDRTYDFFVINNDFDYSYPNHEENNFQYIMYGDISYDNRNIFDTGIYVGKILSYYNTERIEPENLPVELINIVYRYIIAIKFNGTGFNKIIYPYCRGHLSGMASGVKIYLTSDIEYLGNCGVIFEESARENNKINIIVNTLGISSDESRQNWLSIDLMIFPNIVKTFEFDVTDQLTAYPRGGIITVDIDEDL